MAEPLLTPRDGTPDLLVDPADIAEAAAALAAGHGPLAVDTERASAYVYGDRALLIQLRRAGAGTFLIDPETADGATNSLPEALNSLTWVLHASPSDLPCLTALGLCPAQLFDTEIAGRLLGVDHVNLAHMTEHFLGWSLAKGHGRENWSQRPLPADWLTYAALDVELLIELADVMGDALAELGRTDWLLDETTAILDRFRPDAADEGARAPLNNPNLEGWRSLRGVGALRSRRQLGVARELWLERDRRARQTDTSPTRIMAHDVIVRIARELPRSPSELAAIKGFPRRRRGNTSSWFAVLQEALALPTDRLPDRLRRRPGGAPRHQYWPERAPEAARALESLEPAYRAAADNLGIDAEVLLAPKLMRKVAWILGGGEAGNGVPAPVDVEDVRAVLRSVGALPWQEDILTAVCMDAVLLPRAIPLP